MAEVNASVVIHRENKVRREENRRFLRVLCREYPALFPSGSVVPPPPPVPPAPAVSVVRPSAVERYAKRHTGRGGAISRAIIAAVAAEFGLTPIELTDHKRVRPRPRARFIAYRMLRDVTWANGDPRYSTPQIAYLMNRDHSTVVYGLQQFDLWAARDDEFRRTYERLHRAVTMVPE